MPIQFTSIRVVCQDPLTLALGDDESFGPIDTPDVKHRLKAAGHLGEPRAVALPQVGNPSLATVEDR